MAHTTGEIISSLRRKYPLQDVQFLVGNLADQSFGFGRKPLVQFIVGITRADQMTRDISSYNHYMKEQLADITPNVECIPWSFAGDEKDEMKSVLKELNKYFNISLDIDRAIMDLEIPKAGTGTYYIVVTAVTYMTAFDG